MVVAFMIHTVLPGPCRILYSTVFGCDYKFSDGNAGGANFDNFRMNDMSVIPFDLSRKPVDPQNGRVKRKDALAQIALRVQNEFSLKAATAYNSRSFEEELSRVNMDNTLPDFKMGVFRQPAAQFFTTDKMVLWQAALNCGFSLVCEMNENIVLAEHVLRLLIKHLQHYAYVLNRPMDILLKMDRVAIIIDEFLPGGQLLFNNDRAVKQIQRSLEKMLR